MRTTPLHTYTRVSRVYARLRRTPHPTTLPGCGTHMCSPFLCTTRTNRASSQAGPKLHPRTHKNHAPHDISVDHGPPSLAPICGEPPSSIQPARPPTERSTLTGPAETPERLEHKVGTARRKSHHHARTTPPKWHAPSPQTRAPDLSTATGRQDSPTSTSREDEPGDTSAPPRDRRDRPLTHRHPRRRQTASSRARGVVGAPHSHPSNHVLHPYVGDLFQTPASHSGGLPCWLIRLPGRSEWDGSLPFGLARADGHSELVLVSAAHHGLLSRSTPSSPPEVPEAVLEALEALLEDPPVVSRTSTQGRRGPPRAPHQPRPTPALRARTPPPHRTGPVHPCAFHPSPCLFCHSAHCWPPDHTPNRQLCPSSPPATTSGRADHSPRQTATHA